LKKGNISILRTAFRHKCPACGIGDIYEKLLDVHTRCQECRLPLKNHDAGDGPTFFSMLISGIIITALAFLVEIYFMISLWLHIVIWFPTTIGLAIILLKIIKSSLIGLQYRHNVGSLKDK
jgi:uncharacterized protein (DUF983 family)